jgi:hypothetical protein
MGTLILLYVLSVFMFALARATTTERDGIFYYILGMPGAGNLWSIVSLFIGGFIWMLGIFYFFGYFVRN